MSASYHLVAYLHPALTIYSLSSLEACGIPHKNPVIQVPIPTFCTLQLPKYAVAGPLRTSLSQVVMERVTHSAQIVQRFNVLFLLHFLLGLPTLKGIFLAVGIFLANYGFVFYRGYFFHEVNLIFHCMNVYRYLPINVGVPGYT